MKKLLALVSLIALFSLNGCERVAPMPGSVSMVPSGAPAATVIHDTSANVEGSSHAVKKADGFYIDSDYGSSHISD